jgi:hypothetical protein
MLRKTPFAEGLHINPLEALVAINAPPVHDTPPASRTQMAAHAAASTPRRDPLAAALPS